MLGTSAVPSIATTTALETTTSTASPPEPKLTLQFKLQQNFTAQLANTSSPEFKELKNKVSAALDQVYSAKYGTNFNRTVINGFSQGSVVVDAEVIFNDVSSLPTTRSVAEALVSAASSSNFSLSINTSSIVVTDPLSPSPTAGTSAAPTKATIAALETTKTAAPTSEEKIVLEFKLLQNFTEQLANKSSPEFKELQNTVSTALDQVYSSKYGALFKRTVITSFSQGSIVVKTEVIFNDASSLPNASSVAETLVTAASSSTFSLSINTSSIAATSSSTATTAPTTLPTLPLDRTSVPNTTVAPTNAPSTDAASSATPNATPTMTAASTFSTAPPTNPTSMMTSSITEATTTAASTNPPSSSEGTLGLQFSLNQTFTSDLSNSSSTAYKTLSSTVVSQVNMICQKIYSSTFSRSIVNMFTRGSVVVDMTLVYKNKSSIPSTSSATTKLSTELTSITTSLNIIPGSVIAHSSTSDSPPRPQVVSLAIFFSFSLLAVGHVLTVL
ncbi:uncharacterized protein LKV04_000739 [Tautogolabrus adspersus]